MSNLDRYNEQGFLLLESFFSRDEVSGFRDEIDSIINKWTAGKEQADNAVVLNDRLEKDDYDALDYSDEVGFHYDEVVNEDGVAEIIPRSIINLYLSGSVFHDLTFNERLLEAVESITGPEIRFFNSRCFLKPPKGLGTKWHRDIEFFDCTPNPIINCLIFLEDQTKENGCLKAVPGSHRKQHRGHLDIEKEFGFTPEGPFGHLPGEQYLECPAGTVVLLDHFTLHGSETNHSNKHRKLVSLGYAGAGVCNMQGEAQPSVMVKGSWQPGEVDKAALV